MACSWLVSEIFPLSFEMGKSLDAQKPIAMEKIKQILITVNDNDSFGGVGDVGEDTGFEDRFGISIKPVYQNFKVWTVNWRDTLERVDNLCLVV